MAQRQGATVDVDDSGVDAEYAGGVDRNRGKSLVYLDEIQVIRAPSSLLERELPCVSGDGQQVGRLLGYFGMRHDGAKWFEAAPLGETLTGEHEGARAVGHAGSIAGGHGAALVHGLERCQLFDSSVV